MQQEEDLAKTQKETCPKYHQYVCTSCIGKSKCSTSRWQYKFRNYHEVSKQSIGKSNFSSSLMQDNILIIQITETLILSKFLQGNHKKEELVHMFDAKHG